MFTQIVPEGEGTGIYLNTYLPAGLPWHDVNLDKPNYQKTLSTQLIFMQKIYVRVCSMVLRKHAGM